MNFPLTISDIGLWLAFMAIIHLITSELIFSSIQYSTNFIIDKKRFRLVALALGIGFMIIVIIFAYSNPPT